MKAIHITIIALAFLTVIGMGFTKLPQPGEPKGPVEIKVTGDFKKQPVFLLKLNNAEETEFLVRVKDENGEVLYSEILKTKIISRKYQLGTNDEEINEVFHVQFEIIKVRTNEIYIYNVSRTARSVRESVVAQL